MMGNGDVQQISTLSAARKTDDFDIKDIQQKKQQAEQKRFANSFSWLKKKLGSLSITKKEKF